MGSAQVETRDRTEHLVIVLVSRVGVAEGRRRISRADYIPYRTLCDCRFWRCALWSRSETVVSLDCFGQTGLLPCHNDHVHTGDVNMGLWGNWRSFSLELVSRKARSQALTKMTTKFELT